MHATSVNDSLLCSCMYTVVMWSYSGHFSQISKFFFCLCSQINVLVKTEWRDLVSELMVTVHQKWSYMVIIIETGGYAHVKLLWLVRQWWAMCRVIKREQINKCWPDWYSYYRSWTSSMFKPVTKNLIGAEGRGSSVSKSMSWRWLFGMMEPNQFGLIIWFGVDEPWYSMHK